MQQPVAEERAFGIVHQAFVTPITYSAQGTCWQHDFAPAALVVEAQGRLGEVVEQQLVQMQHQRCFTVEEEAQTVDLHLPEQGVAGGGQVDAQAGDQVGAVAVESGALHFGERGLLHGNRP